MNWRSCQSRGDPRGRLLQAKDGAMSMPMQGLASGVDPTPQHSGYCSTSSGAAQEGRASV